MRVRYDPKAAARIRKQIDYVQGPGTQRLAESIASALVEGNRHDRVSGLDADGAPLSPLRSRRKGEYAGKSGQPLAPSGASSRVVANFRATVRRQGKGWRILAGWVGVVSSRGVHFLRSHDRGSGRLPRRHIFGASPRTMERIRKLVRDWKSTVKGIGR